MDAATPMFSATVRVPKSSKRWNVRPSPSRARRYEDIPRRSRASRRTHPAFGRCMPVTTLNKVVFPAPFGPIHPVTEPPAALRDTSESPAKPPNRTEMLSTSRPTGTSGPREGGQLVSRCVGALVGCCVREEGVPLLLRAAFGEPEGGRRDPRPVIGDIRRHRKQREIDHQDDGHRPVT